MEETKGEENSQWFFPKTDYVQQFELENTTQIYRGYAVELSIGGVAPSAAQHKSKTPDTINYFKKKQPKSPKGGGEGGLKQLTLKL